MRESREKREIYIAAIKTIPGVIGGTHVNDTIQGL